MIMNKGAVMTFVSVLLVGLAGISAGASEPGAEGDKEGFVWMQNLEKARAKATVEKKPLFVLFRCEP